MVEHEAPRTRLEQLLRQQHVKEFRKNYQRAAKGTVLSERQAYQWVVPAVRPAVRYPGAAAGAGPGQISAGAGCAAEARDRGQPDELDILGGICNFSRPPQLHYAAEALSWGGAPQASHAEQFALEALNAYAVAPQGSSIRNEANTRRALAVARVARGEVDGATEALVPVLELPPAQRTHTIVTSVGRVRTALQALKDPGRDAIELAGAIEAFTAGRHAAAMTRTTQFR